MSNSKLVCYTKLSPNCTKPRNHKIDTITIHHMAGNLSVESCGEVFAPTTRQASSNYGIGTDGRVGLYVDEANRSWCSSSRDNDNRAITIEVANDEIGGNWHVSDKAFSALIDLCVDICKRNEISKLNYTGDKNGNLTMHKWFAATACPGPYLESRFSEIANLVNARLGEAVPDSTEKPSASVGTVEEHTNTLYRVRKSWTDAKSQIGAFRNLSNAKRLADANPQYSVFAEDGHLVYPIEDGAQLADKENVFSPYLVQVKTSGLEIRRGPGTEFQTTGYTGKGVFTIVEEATKLDGSRWGLLKAYMSKRNGWIFLAGITVI